MSSYLHIVEDMRKDPKIGEMKEIYKEIELHKKQENIFRESYHSSQFEGFSKSDSLLDPNKKRNLDNDFNKLQKMKNGNGDDTPNDQSMWWDQRTSIIPNETVKIPKVKPHGIVLEQSYSRKLLNWITNKFKRENVNNNDSKWWD